FAGTGGLSVQVGACQYQKTINQYEDISFHMFNQEC
ncbi:MAG: hypothetical protein H6Q26_1190, partial [Bacteroidetes bacterium]|nr:hypothetical protein [Bacteroidota bacterium]